MRRRRSYRSASTPLPGVPSARIRPFFFTRAVARAMSHDPADPTRLDAWAARLHISPKTLQRDFVREFGVPFTRRRTLLRLHAARPLLGADSVTAVAHRVGYATASAFIAAFAKEFGTPPGQFVRKLP